jgi:2'-5' RNA ligase
MARIRTFLAVDVGTEVRKRAAALQQQLARTGVEVKWVAPDQMHLTLLFLGDVNELDLVKVCRAVKEVAATEPPFPLRVAGVGAFPNNRRPKILWGGVTDGADALRRIYGALEARLIDLGVYRKEDRDYTPHLTLGRLKADGGEDLAKELPKLMAWDGGRAVVDEVLVYSSELRRDGPEYAVIGRGELAGRSEAG